jgi:hypothetical protein
VDDFNQQFPYGVAAIVFFCLIMAAFVALQITVFWKIFSKAGHPGALSLLMLVPLVNVGMMIYLAFGEWPVLLELAALRRRVGGTGDSSQ